MLRDAEPLVAGWRCDLDVQPDHSMHVWPEHDLVAHDLNGADCACGPRFEQATRGVVIVVHASLDGRELPELAAK